MVVCAVTQQNLRSTLLMVLLVVLQILSTLESFCCPCCSHFDPLSHSHLSCQQCEVLRSTMRSINFHTSHPLLMNSSYLVQFPELSLALHAFALQCICSQSVCERVWNHTSHHIIDEKMGGFPWKCCYMARMLTPDTSMHLNAGKRS